MQRKYSISFFVIIIALIMSASWAFYESNEMAKIRRNIEEQQKEEAREESRKKDDSTSVNGSDVEAQGPNSGYYLKAEDGYVVVYLFDQETVYEETTIPLDELDESLAQEIRQVKYLKSTEELYGFLENYSS